MIRDHRSTGSPARITAGPDSSTTICTWEVLPSDSRFPIVASGITNDADKARHEVEAAMAKPGSGFGHLVRTAIPGLSYDQKDRKLWPPLGEVQQCRRNRTGGFSWRPLYPSISDRAAS
jgi:hypothetical protein